MFIVTTNFIQKTLYFHFATMLLSLMKQKNSSLKEVEVRHSWWAQQLSELQFSNVSLWRVCIQFNYIYNWWCNVAFRSLCLPKLYILAQLTIAPSEKNNGRKIWSGQKLSMAEDCLARWGMFDNVSGRADWNLDTFRDCCL